jgi:nucleotide-binding universal stress UspA family protein
LDGSAESNAALPLARTLARAKNASITLLRVVSHDDPRSSRVAASNLQWVATELEESKIQVDSVVRHGRVADAILAEVRARLVALVVMRTHGRSGVERAVLGSVADQVLTHSPVPVVLLRTGERRVTGINRLLVPVDGSPGSSIALGQAVALAQATGASIKLVHVTVPVALQSMVTYDLGGMGYYDPHLDDDELVSASRHIDGLVGQLRQAGVQADGEALMASSAARAIADSAERFVADLIVMTTRALTGPARTLLGSVANGVVRTAPCPVLLLHQTQEPALTTPAGAAVGGRTD